MANQIPLLEGTDLAGGFLVPDGQAGVVFERGLNRQSAVAGMPGLRIRRVPGKREKLTEYVGRPAVTTVAEAGPKVATGAEYAQVTLDMVKGAAIVMYTQELIEDAQEDPTVLINNDVRSAFADWLDSNALGRTSSGQIVGAFNSELSETSQTTEIGTTGDALAKSISAAMALIEGNGYNPTGAILSWTAKANLRDARTTGDASIPLYSGGVQGGFVQPDPELFGIPLRFTTNLQAMGAPAAGRVIGVVGDFSQAVLGIRQDIQVDFSDQATVDVGGTLHHMWQQNKVGSRWEARMGFVAHDLNRAFVAIIDAA